MEFTCIDCGQPTPAHIYDGDEKVCYFCLENVDTKTFDDILTVLVDNKIDFDYIENFHLQKTPQPGMKYGCVFHIYVKDDLNEDLGEMSDGTKYKDIIDLG